MLLQLTTLLRSGMAAGSSQADWPTAAAQRLHSRLWMLPSSDTPSQAPCMALQAELLSAIAALLSHPDSRRQLVPAAIIQLARGTQVACRKCFIRHPSEHGAGSLKAAAPGNPMQPGLLKAAALLLLSRNLGRAVSPALPAGEEWWPTQADVTLVCMHPAYEARAAGLKALLGLQQGDAPYPHTSISRLVNC